MASKRIVTICTLIILSLSSFVLREKRNLNIVFIGDSITHGAQLKVPATQAPPAHAAAYLKQQSAFDKVQFSNQGVSGFTTSDFLPATGTAYKKVKVAANIFYADKSATLVFSMMLGTNDSAIKGPHGSPFTPVAYRENLKIITDSLLMAYPESKIIINHPIWYSPNTDNGHSSYMQEGLDRIQAYFIEIDALVKTYKKTNPGHVFVGDKKGYGYFDKNHLTDHVAEKGPKGVFYLHPNEKGAMALGALWGKAITKALD